jgi:hypothetical protein
MARKLAVRFFPRFLYGLRRVADVVKISLIHDFFVFPNRSYPPLVALTPMDTFYAASAVLVQFSVLLV